MIRRIVALAVMTLALGAFVAEAQAAGGQAVLTLVTEHVEQDADTGSATRYWWSNPTEPAWTQTDTALRKAFDDAGVRTLRPADDVRISSIYRRPDLSVDNAAALASIVGANRVLTGRITLDRSLASPLWGVEAVGVRADLKLLDTSGSEAAILREFEFERELYRGQGRIPLVDKARRAVADTTAALLNRTLVASSGPIGPVDSGEPGLALHGLKRAAVLEMLRNRLVEAEFVDAVGIAWATDGVIVLEINPDSRDGDALVRRAGRLLESVDVRGLRMRRRDTSPAGALGWDVTVTSGFERPSGASRR